MRIDRSRFDALYRTYNSRKWVHPDPLEFLYHYPEIRDREIVGLVASSLAYGRVEQVLKSVSAVLDKMGSSPFRFVDSGGEHLFRKTFSGFKHRFTTGEDLAELFLGIRCVLGRYGSIRECFLTGMGDDQETVLPALEFVVGELSRESRKGTNTLLPSPAKGSACKRLHLYLRWMVREDRVDPGGWSAVSPHQLLVPLDTHMHRIAVRLGLTKRRQANLKTALEVTGAFRKISREDPVRYDFSLTRLGIRKDLELEEIFGR